MNQAKLLPQSISEALTKHHIIPDIFSETFDVSNVTKTLMTVEYPGNTSATMGNFLPLDKTQTRPTIQCLAIPSPTSSSGSNPIDVKSKYTLTMSDPDGSTEFCHWVATGLSASQIDNVVNVVKYDQETATELVPFVTPAPRKGTGPHRYIFCLFKGTVDAKSPLLTQINEVERRNWGYKTPGMGVQQFSKDTGNLELVGINFFYVENK